MINLKYSNTEEPFYDVEMNDQGTIYYYNKLGLLHRLNGPAVESPDGYKEYWVNGKLHRIDGPAIDAGNGFKEYLVNHTIHRIDGPAIIYPDGSVEFWINGKQLSPEEFYRLTKNKKNND